MCTVKTVRVCENTAQFSYYYYFIQILGNIYCVALHIEPTYLRILRDESNNVFHVEERYFVIP